MLASEYMFNHWPEFKEQIHQKWGGLNDEDLDKAAGRYSEVVNLLHEKLSLPKFEIEDCLEHMLPEDDTESETSFTVKKDPLRDSRHF